MMRMNNELSVFLRDGLADAGTVGRLERRREYSGEQVHKGERGQCAMDIQLYKYSSPV